MATPLQSASIAAPGFYGLNTQESGITLESGFALQAQNCVIDKYGRLGARKGWTFLAESTGVNLKGMHRFVDINGAEYFGMWSDTSFYQLSGNSLVPVTYTNTPGINSVTTGDWQAATLNDAAYLFQGGYEPIYFSPTAGVLDDITTQGKGTPPQANTVLSAYGRLWVANTPTNKTTVYWSDLLDGAEWRHGTGTVGSLDISSILVNGNDEIVALGAHNGYLIIFCKQNIVIMGDSDNNQTYLDPATMQLVEVISGIGCIARDSVQNTGTDILFLSESGVRSLGRTIQEKSQPMRDLSRNVRDDLVQLLESETKSKIKSCYSESQAFYLLAFPTTRQVYCFDMRSALQDGSARVTQWTNLDHTDWLGFDGEVYMTNENGLARYFGYSDNGSAYRMIYFTNFFDMGNASQTKILKRLAITVIGATGQDFVVKSGFDYSDVYNSYALSVRQGVIHEYNDAEFGLITNTSAVSQGADTITDADGNHYTVDFVLDNALYPAYTATYKAWLDTDGYYYTVDDGTRTETTLYVQPSHFGAEYSGGALVDTVRVAGSGAGSVLQLGFEAELNGGALSIQKMDIYVKQGRTI